MLQLFIYRFQLLVQLFVDMFHLNGFATINIIIVVFTAFIHLFIIASVVCLQLHSADYLQLDEMFC
jgi:hypothetical protein